MKTCSEPGCTRKPLNEYCPYHQFRLYMKGGRLYKPRKPKQAKKIPAKSKKRQRDEVHYKDHCKELEQELRAKDPQHKIYCFFSGEEITGKPTWHHLYGRSGDWYTDKEGLVPCINEYHLMFHHMTVEKLEEQVWYPEFLERLKSRDYSLWEKQLGKKQKSTKLNPTLFDDEDDEFFL